MIVKSIVVICDDCGNHVGSDCGSQYDECDICGGDSFVEQDYYGCTACKDDLVTDIPFDVCPICGEPA